MSGTAPEARCLSRLCCLHQSPQSLLSGAPIPLSVSHKGEEIWIHFSELADASPAKAPFLPTQLTPLTEQNLSSLSATAMKCSITSKCENGEVEKGGEERRKNKALGQDKRAETQEHFPRLTVAGEKCAIGFHGCSRSRQQQRKGSENQLCPEVSAAAGRQPEPPGSPCSPLQQPPTAAPSGEPAPCPWLELRARYDSSFISPASARRRLPSAPTAAKRRSGPSSSLLQFGVFAAGPASSCRCCCRWSFPAMLLCLWLPHFRAATFSASSRRRVF